MTADVRLWPLAAVQRFAKSCPLLRGKQTTN